MRHMECIAKNYFYLNREETGKKQTYFNIKISNTKVSTFQKT